MKGILPLYFRFAGYILLLLSVFVPMLMYMFGMVSDANLIALRAVMKLVIWISLFMVFLAKTKDEGAESAAIRLKSLKHATCMLGVYYVVMLVREALSGATVSADNSAVLVYMALSVLCLEFLLQKNRIEKMFKK